MRSQHRNGSNLHSSRNFLGSGKRDLNSFQADARGGAGDRDPVVIADDLDGGVAPAVDIRALRGGRRLRHRSNRVIERMDDLVTSRFSVPEVAIGARGRLTLARTGS